MVISFLIHAIKLMFVLKKMSLIGKPTKFNIQSFGNPHISIIKGCSKNIANLKNFWLVEIIEEPRAPTKK